MADYFLDNQFRDLLGIIFYDFTFLMLKKLLIIEMMIEFLFCYRFLYSLSAFIILTFFEV